MRLRPLTFLYKLTLFYVILNLIHHLTKRPRAASHLSIRSSDGSSICRNKPEDENFVTLSL